MILLNFIDELSLPTPVMSRNLFVFWKDDGVSVEHTGESIRTHLTRDLLNSAWEHSEAKSSLPVGSPAIFSAS